MLFYLLQFSYKKISKSVNSFAIEDQNTVPLKSN